MPSASDEEHFDWLVEGRSRNQQATLRLYRVIRSNRQALGKRLVARQAVSNFLESPFRFGAPSF